MSAAGGAVALGDATQSTGGIERPRNPTELFRWALPSFPRFCSLLKVRAKSPEGVELGRIPMRLTGLQRAYNRRRTARDIICKPRQVYFTTLEGARDLWWFLTRPGARVVLVCQSQTDMTAIRDISEKFRIFFECLEEVGLKLDFGRRTWTEWTLPKRDATMRIIQAGATEVSASKKGRGGTINRLHFTEAAFYECAASTFNGLQESVPKGRGEIVNESTPNGAGGFFYEQWQSAIGEGKHRSAFTPHFYSWWLHDEYRSPLSPGETFTPETELEKTLFEQGVSAECLKWYREKILEKGGNARLVSQEYPSDPHTCFLTTGSCFFDIEKVESQIRRAKDPIRVDWHDALKIFHEPVPGLDYVIGADPSEGGKKSDQCAAVVLERGTGRHMATLLGLWIPWEFGRLLGELGTLYNTAVLAVERNNHGHAVIQALERHVHYANLYKHTDGKIGWPTHEVTRAPMLDALDASHRSGTFQTDDASTLVEMRNFITHPDGKPAGMAGEFDDLVLALGIGWAVLQLPLNRVREYDFYGPEDD